MLYDPEKFCSNRFGLAKQAMDYATKKVLERRKAKK